MSVVPVICILVIVIFHLIIALLHVEQFPLFVIKDDVVRGCVRHGRESLGCRERGCVNPLVIIPYTRNG